MSAPLHLLCVAPLPVQQIPEQRWITIEEEVREGLTFGVERFILDLTGAVEIRPLDYWMLLNLAILIPAGKMVVVGDQERLAESLKQSRLISLIPWVEHLADAYALLTGIAVGPAPSTTPSLSLPALSAGQAEA